MKSLPDHNFVKAAQHKLIPSVNAICVINEDGTVSHSSHRPSKPTATALYLDFLFGNSIKKYRSRRLTHPSEVEEEREWFKSVDPSDLILFEEALHEKAAAILISIFSSVQDLSTI